MATRRIQDLENIEEVLPDSIIPVGESTKTKSMLVSQLKNWLSSFFVGKTGNETIAGVKTFISTQKIQGQGKPLEFKSPDIDLTTAPSSNKSMLIDYLDKNGTRIGVVGAGYYPSGDSRMYFQIGNLANLSIGKRSDNSVYTYAPANSGTNTIVTTLGHSKAQNGYYKLGNGLIIQWGLNEFQSGSTTITLPTAFTSSNYSVASCAKDATGTYCVGMLVESKTTTNFVGHGWNTTGRVKTTNFWIAIGY